MRMRGLLLVSTMSVLLSIPLSAQMSGGGPSNMMSTEILALAAGRGPGAEGAQWRTDLWLKSVAGSTVTLEFHPNDSATDAAAATASVTMTSPVMYLQDVLKNTFGLDQAFGNIVIRGTKAVSATLRVYTTTGVGRSVGKE